MTYNFDEAVDRTDTYSIKYDMAGRGKPADLLPLWVADMDFRSPPCVLHALEERVRHGVFGYSEADAAYFETLRVWFEKRFGWGLSADWLVKTPGVVYAVHTAVRGLTAEGDAVIIQQPVYYPFSSAVRKTGRKLVVNELIYENGGYSIDFEDFERKIVENRVKLFILCSPHNPVGRVWTKAELTRLGEICLRHGVLVVADEIHQDFIYEGRRHTVFSGMSPELADITITCTSPSKTFNLAGLHNSNNFIPNKELRGRFLAEYERSGMSQLGVTGLVACKAAYDGGEGWLTELLGYISDNMGFMMKYIDENIPGVKMVKPEGTYLAWLDFSALGLKRSELESLIVEGARLWLDGGHIFGAGGDGFQRVNAACPRATLAEAMSRIKEAVSRL